MDVRPLAMAAGLLTLVAIGLAGAVLLGESARISTPGQEPAAFDSAHPEPPPIILQRMPSESEGTSSPAISASPPSPAIEQAPPATVHEPAVVHHPHRTLQAALPLARDRDQAELTPPSAEPPPADVAAPAVRHPHRTLQAAPPLAQDRDQAEPTPPAAGPSVQEPVPPRPRPPDVDHRYDGVLTVAAIGRLKRSLRLSPDQEPYWPPVAALLREVGRRQMAQVDAGQRPTFDLPGDLSSRLYSAAMPLLGTLREDQKAVVRQHARSLGLGSVASFI